MFKRTSALLRQLSVPQEIFRKGRKWNNRKFFRKIFLRQLSVPQEIFRKEENGITGNVTKLILCNSVLYLRREKYPNTELFLVRIFLYSVRKQENTDQK